MTTIYILCAVVGGTIFVLQLVLSLLGGGDHGVDHDAGGVVDHDAHFWGIFGLRAIVAGVTAFGLGGMLAKSLGASPLLSTPAALACAFAAALLVAVLLRSLTKLSDDGTARIETSVGKSGVVYINIPADKQGLGKVHLQLQNRTVELDAITYGNALDTGTRVVVTSVIGPSTVEVIAAPEMATAYAQV
jgi:membrane protein implicated in regulation of membrane protease activity